MANLINISKFGINVGPEEAASMRGWDVIINVNDAMPKNLDPYPAKVFWFPINEVAPWGYAPFFFTKRLLDFYTTKKCNILVHCSAGAHRSPAMVYGWLTSKGFTTQQCNMFLRRDFTQEWERDIEDGTIPKNLPSFYTVMNTRSTYSLMGVLNEMAQRDQLSKEEAVALVRTR